MERFVKMQPSDTLVAGHVVYNGKPPYETLGRKHQLTLSLTMRQNGEDYEIIIDLYQTGDATTYLQSVASIYPTIAA